MGRGGIIIELHLESVFRFGIGRYFIGMRLTDIMATILCCGGVYQVSIRLGTLSTQKRRRRGSRAMCLSGS